MESIRKLLALPEGGGSSEASQYDLYKRMGRIEGIVDSLERIAQTHGSDIGQIFDDLRNKQLTLESIMGDLQNKQAQLENNARAILAQQRDLQNAFTLAQDAYANSQSAFGDAQTAFQQTTAVVAKLESNYNAFKSAVEKTFQDIQADASAMRTSMGNVAARLTAFGANLWNIHLANQNLYNVFGNFTSIMYNFYLAAYNVQSYLRASVDAITSWSLSGVQNAFAYVRAAGENFATIKDRAFNMYQNFESGMSSFGTIMNNFADGRTNLLAAVMHFNQFRDDSRTTWSNLSGNFNQIQAAFTLEGL